VESSAAADEAIALGSSGEEVPARARENPWVAKMAETIARLRILAKMLADTAAVEEAAHGAFEVADSAEASAVIEDFGADSAEEEEAGVAARTISGPAAVVAPHAAFGEDAVVAVEDRGPPWKLTATAALKSQSLQQLISHCRPHHQLGQILMLNILRTEHLSHQNVCVVQTAS